MRSHRSQESLRSSLTQFNRPISRICFGLWFSCGLFFLTLFLFLAFEVMVPSCVFARSIATPWATGSGDVSFQSLVYGSSSAADVVRVMGNQPDEVIRGEQMFPVIENYYYYDADKSGSASIFVFENGLLVGLQMLTSGQQLVDMTYLLPSNGDRSLNQPMLGGYMPYYPVFPLTSW